MVKTFITSAVVSKGFDGAPAVSFSEKGESVRFRIGNKVYDSRAENNHRWFNLSVKGFGPICERIRKMELKEGSRINLIGRLDEDTWEDKETHEQKRATVIILDDLEYCFTGNGEKKAGNGQKATADPQYGSAPGYSGNMGYPAPGQYPAAPSAPNQMPSGFTGYEAYGGTNAFFG